MNATSYRVTGVVTAIIACAAFAGSGTVAKSILEAGADPLQVAWLRLTGAAIILLPVVLVLNRRGLVETIRRAWPRLLGYGLVGMAASQVLFFVAVQRLPVGVAILLQFSGPLLIIGWVRWVRHKRVPRTASVGVIISIVGLAIVVQIWTGIAFDLLGVLAGVGAAVCQAAYFLIIEDLKESAPLLVMTASGTVVASLALTVVAMPWTFPWAVLGDTVGLGPTGVPGWVAAAWLIVICAVAAYLLEGFAVRRLSAVVGGAIAYVEVVMGALYAWILLGEALGPAEIVGGSVVLIGAYIAQLPARRPKQVRSEIPIEFPGLIGAESLHEDVPEIDRR